jgi:hypothetical protein
VRHGVTWKDTQKLSASPALQRPSEFRTKESAKIDMLKLKHRADVAQLVEQSIRNRQVIGSSPIVGSILSLSLRSNR